MFWVKLPSGQFVNLNLVQKTVPGIEFGESTINIKGIDGEWTMYRGEDAKTVLGHLNSIHSDAMIEQFERAKKRQSIHPYGAED